MRVAAQVFLGYGVLLLLGAVWRLLHIETAVPNVVALSAVYLGLTARSVMVGPIAMRLAPATFGAVILGYLADLLIGSPHGMLALTAGVVCVVGHLTHNALIVRGRLLTVIFSFVTGVVAGLVMIVLRAWAGLIPGGLGNETIMLLASAVLTGFAGPLVFWLCRWVDARFARTHRERDATLGGIAL